MRCESSAIARLTRVVQSCGSLGEAIVWHTGWKRAAARDEKGVSLYGYLDVSNNFMEQILNIENREVKLKFNDGANCWQTQTIIDNLEIEIEIDYFFHKEKEVDWEHFADFHTFLCKKNRLNELIRDSEKLVTELGKAFYRDCYENVADYKMVFSNSIFYKGKTDGTFVQNGYSYSLIFNYWTKRANGIQGDEFGLYLVDIENYIIVGAKRHQC